MSKSNISVRSEAQRRTAERYKQRTFLFGAAARSGRNEWTLLPLDFIGIDEMDDVMTSLEWKATARDMEEAEA